MAHKLKAGCSATLSLYFQHGCNFAEWNVYFNGQFLGYANMNTEGGQTEVGPWPITVPDCKDDNEFRFDYVGSTNGGIHWGPFASVESSRGTFGFGVTGPSLTFTSKRLCSCCKDS